MKNKAYKKISKTACLSNTIIESEIIRIDDGVKLEGVFIKAKKVIIKKNSSLINCKLLSNGIISIGEDSIIKENSVINASKEISIGNRTIIDRDVIIGGMQSDKSEISVGDDCVILYRSYLNTTKKISIGNNVGIGGYNLIFTHSAWQNVLDGNPFKFADVMIENNVWLPWNVTVMPGIKIGVNSTIGSGSVITKNIPSNVFAAGVPAKIIRQKITQKLTMSEKDKIVEGILDDFRDYLSGFLEITNHVSKTNNNYRIYTKNDSLVYSINCNVKANDILISFKIPKNNKLNREWIELDSLRGKVKSELAKSFVMFIRRYGIKIDSI